jgi:Protein of unknown function (DUF2934)
VRLTVPYPHSGERQLPAPDRDSEHTLRERAYYIWEREGCPEGQAEAHWLLAAREQSGNEPTDEFMEDEEKILAGRSDANMPALLTKDVQGG